MDNQSRILHALHVTKPTASNYEWRQKLSTKYGLDTGVGVIQTKNKATLFQISSALILLQLLFSSIF